MAKYNTPTLALIEKRRNVVAAATVLTCLILANCTTLQPAYFSLRFVDDKTGRGIPLVEIETTNRVRFVSDSAGRIAIQPNDIASHSVYFYVRSHGYEMTKDKQEFQGISVKVEPGKEQLVPLHRVNIAERLYRETGEGIYRDSQLLGMPTPLPYETDPRGGVFGQDSVVNAIYADQLYWFWGDTKRGDGPLGNFKVSGAVSPLGESNRYDPAEAIDLRYFVGEDGFVREMFPFKDNGPVWVHSPLVLKDNGRESLFCGYYVMSSAYTRSEAGIAKWNDKKKIFEKYIEWPHDTRFTLHGSPVRIVSDGVAWFYFGSPIPDTRVRADLHDLLNMKNYQAYTCLQPGSHWSDDAPPLDLDEKGELVWGWKADTDPITPGRWKTLREKGLVQDNENKFAFVDTETGDRVIPHTGSLSWNEYRQRWILIFGQIGGTSSFLGEVWYAESLQPEGPWSAARKIVTHDSYSFYNVKQHPYFAKGKYIYFEGTYTQTFSGSDQATPRYDYNQIMYRLDLDDPRLPHMAGHNPQNNPIVD